MTRKTNPVRMDGEEYVSGVGSLESSFQWKVSPEGITETESTVGVGNRDTVVR